MTGHWRGEGATGSGPPSACPLILEVQAAKAGLIARITEPIRSVLAQAGVSLAQLDVVELVGGGVRMPRVQAELKAFLAGSGAAAASAAEIQLGQHLNGDEAMALGAAFAAANRSSSFRVRQVRPSLLSAPFPPAASFLSCLLLVCCHSPAAAAAATAAAPSSAQVGMVDAYPWAVGVRLAHLHPSAAAAPAAPEAATPADAEAEEGGVAASASGKAWHKRSSLFRAYSPVNSTKRISFTADRELRAVLFYEAAAEGGAPLPAGTPRTLGAFNITGVEDMVARLDALSASNSSADSADTAGNATATPRPKPLTFVGAPKVHVTFELDSSGVVRVLRAEGTAEEEYTPTATPKPRPTWTPVPKPASNATNASAPNATAADSADLNATVANATAGVANASLLANATAGGAAESENSTAAAAAAQPPLTARRTHRFALVITPAPADESAAGTVTPYGPEDRAASGATLADLAARDEAKRAVERAKSTLEAFVYASRDRIEASTADEGSDLLAASTSEQREVVGVALSDAESWLYDDGATAGVVEYEAKLAAVQALVNPLLRRADEFGRRPRVINETRALLAGVAKTIAAWNKTHPQVSQSECKASAVCGFSNGSCLHSGWGARTEAVEYGWGDARVACQVADFQGGNVFLSAPKSSVQGGWPGCVSEACASPAVQV